MKMYEYGPVPADHVDSYIDMVMRREINDFATKPVDFYLESLRLAQQYASLGPDSHILDVGCSSGRFIVEAAHAAGVSSHLFGLDPDPSSHANYFPSDLDRSKFTFMQGVGESIPLPDDSVGVVTAHNVVFRARHTLGVLDEMKRVTEPGGLIMVSTNAFDHAYWRHEFESWIADEVGERTNMHIDPLQPPAHGCYLGDLPDIVAASGGLEIIDTVTQQCEARITRGMRLGLYSYSLDLSVNRLPNSGGDVRRIWRSVVAERIVPFIEKRIAEREALFKMAGKTEEPYFADSVHRGMVVLRNNKGRGLVPVPPSLFALGDVEAA